MKRVVTFVHETLKGYHIFEDAEACFAKLLLIFSLFDNIL